MERRWASDKTPASLSLFVCWLCCFPEFPTASSSRLTAKLTHDFFNGDTVAIAQALLGKYQVLLKGEMTHRVPIGTSAAGNIQRLDNALAGIPARLEKTEQQLDNLRSQQEAAQAELGKPFPQEAELAEKSARLAELDALLNMDDRGNDDPDRERTTEKPSVLAELRDRAGRIPPMAHRDDEEVAL